MTAFGIERSELGLTVGCLLGMVDRESETVPLGCSIGCKLGLFSRASVGLLVVGRKKFHAGCNVGSLVEGSDEGSVEAGEKRIE